MNRAHANAREDNTELERVVEILKPLVTIVYSPEQTKPEVMATIDETIKDITTYAQSVAEEAVRGAYKNAIALSDKIELSEDLLDEGVGQWKAFKRFRNTLRDTYLTPLPDKE